MINKIKNNYKLLGKAFSNILYYFKNTATTYPKSPGTSYALINLDNKIMNQEGGRFFYLLCQYVERSGLKVIANTNLYYFLIMRPSKKLLLSKNYLLVRGMKTPVNSIVSVRDGREQVISVVHGLKTLQQKEQHYSLPYPMHPVQVESFNRTILENIRCTKKTIKILFSGIWTEEQYNVPLGEYNVIPRAQVIRFIINKFKSKNILKLVSDRNEFTSLIEGNPLKEQIVISEVKTRDEDWMKLLSLTEFFISPPGFAYPWCHNSVEAMATGAIPILQYSNLFVPELVHMENCISFHNTDELEAAIISALTLPPEEVARLRKNVIAYYDRHLSPEAIADKLKNISENGESEVEMALPYIY